MLRAAVVAAAALAATSPASAVRPSFAEVVIEAGFHVEQPVLSASLLGDEQRQIIIAGHDDDHQQHLAVYGLTPDMAGPTPELLALRPGPNLIAYDVGRIGDRDALFFIEPGRILRYDFAAREFVEVVRIRTISPMRSWV